MASFLGSKVAVQLHRGGQVEGKIVHIDGTTGTLSIQQDGQNVLNITRAEIADLKILPAQPSITPTTSNRAMNDPAILSMANPIVGSSSSSTSTPKHQHKSIPTGPAAMQNTPSGSRKQTQAKLNKGPRSGTATPDHHSAAKMNKGKGSHQGKRTISNEAESDLEEDFDFDKALKSFDKKKIWEEIKTSDKSDPNLLLVSHNRKHSELANGQEKLAWDQPVLSPSPPPSSSKTIQNGTNDVNNKKGSLDLSDVQKELNRARGEILQQDVQLSDMRDLLSIEQEKTILFEALSGMTVIPETRNAQTDKWNVTLYESVSAHSEAVRKQNQIGKVAGRLVVRFSHSEGKFRYLGPILNLSDNKVVERLPSQYRGNEIGLKPETASIFMRRIKDAIQPSSNS